MGKKAEDLYSNSEFMLHFLIILDLTDYTPKWREGERYRLKCVPPKDILKSYLSVPVNVTLFVKNVFDLIKVKCHL